MFRLSYRSCYFPIKKVTNNKLYLPKGRVIIKRRAFIIRERLSSISISFKYTTNITFLNIINRLKK